MYFVKNCPLVFIRN